MDEQYLTSDLHYALSIDDVETSRPMQVKVTIDFCIIMLRDKMM